MRPGPDLVEAMILRAIEYDLSRDLYGGRLFRPRSEMSGCVVPRMPQRPPVPWMRLTICISPVLLPACGPGCCCCLVQVWRPSRFHASSGSITHRSSTLMRGAMRTAPKLLPALPAASAWRATLHGELPMDQGSPCRRIPCTKSQPHKHRELLSSAAPHASSRPHPEPSHSGASRSFRPSVVSRAFRPSGAFISEQSAPLRRCLFRLPAHPAQAPPHPAQLCSSSTLPRAFCTL